MWKQFLYADQHYQIEWLVSEFTVWSDKHEYAEQATGLPDRWCRCYATPRPATASTPR